MFAEGFRRAERQLERRAFDVIDEDVQVVRIDQRAFGRGAEEIRRVPHDKLIDRGAAGDHHGGRPAGATTRASGTLPGRGNRARISGHHTHVERADVDAQLERVGRHHRSHGAFSQPFLDFAAPVRQISPAIPANALGPAWNVFEVVLQIGRQNFGRQSALCKGDELQVSLEKLGRDAPRFR